MRRPLARLGCPYQWRPIQIENSDMGGEIGDFVKQDA
jgi:hypothetical protein